MAAASVRRDELFDGEVVASPWLTPAGNPNPRWTPAELFGARTIALPDPRLTGPRIAHAYRLILGEVAQHRRHKPERGCHG